MKTVVECLNLARLMIFTLCFAELVALQGIGGCSQNRKVRGVLLRWDWLDERLAWNSVLNRFRERSREMTCCRSVDLE